MQLPEYWLTRPVSQLDPEMVAAFDRLLESALAHGPEHPIDYALDAPKWQFLAHVVARANMVLHGSGDPSIERFEPRQPDDSLDFSNRHAVFAAVDGVWPMYYAVLDRERHPMMLCNACIRVRQSSGALGGPHYYFSISESALVKSPWRTGMVYLLPGESFELQPQIKVGDAHVQIVQAASSQPVAPLAKLVVDPGDFPFLDRIRGHDDEILQARIAADPSGFPWVT